MGQKVNPNIFRLGVNKLWKSEAAITKHKNSSLNNLFIYLSIKNELIRRQVLLSDFKIKNVSKTFEVIIQVLAYFRIKKIRQRYKWWRRFTKKSVLKNNFKLNTHILLLKKLKKKKTYLFKHDIKFYNTWKKKIKNFLFIKSRKSKIKNFYKKKNLILCKKDKLKLVQLKNLLKINKISIKLEQKLKLIYNRAIKVQLINVLNTLPKRNKKINNKIFKKLYKFKKNPALKDFITIISLCLLMKQTFLLNEFLSAEIQKSKKLGQILKIITQVLKKQKKYFLLKGFKLSMWGKLNKAGRSKKRIIRLGDLSFQTLKNKVSQSLVHCNTRYGVIGIKLSIVF